jgi:hypothetical protein
MGFLDQKEQELVQPENNFLNSLESTIKPTNNNFLKQKEQELDFSRSTETMGGGQPRQEVVGQRTMNPELFNKDTKNKKSTLELLFPDQENAQKVWNEISKLKGKEKQAAINRVEGMQGVGGLDPFDPVNLAFILTGAGKAIVSVGKKLPGALAEYAANTVEKENAWYPFKGKLADYLSNKRTPFKLNEIPEVNSELILPKGEPSILGKKELGQISTQETKYPVTTKGLEPVQTGTEDLVEKGINKEQLIREIIKNNPNATHLETNKLVQEALTPLKNKDEFAGSINLSKMPWNKEEQEVAKSILGDKGKVISHEQIQKAADESKVLKKVLSDKDMLDFEAAVYRTKQNAAALLKQDQLTPEAVEALKVVSSNAKLSGRLLEMNKMEVDPVLYSAKARIISKLKDIGIETDKIVEASKNVNWDNSKDVIDFYRQFVKPTIPEILKEMRYINMLSSIKTHIINFTSNATQSLIVRPTAKTMEAGLDVIKKVFTGKDREFFFREIPAYYRGSITATGDSFNKAIKVLQGKESIFRPDLNQIPTNAKFLRSFQLIPKTLEASDIFFRNIITQGEATALMSRGMNKSEAITKASKKAEELIFRKKVDPSNLTGQGNVLSFIDKVTNSIYSLRRIPGGDWVIPFVETPMNIFKQGLEYSPLGVVTLPGNLAKTEQLAKSMVGSIVFGSAAMKAFNGEVTWSMPVDLNEKNAFIASGKQPYSIKIGDNWYSLSRLGTLSYPFAMAAALKYYVQDNKTALTDAEIEKFGRIISGIGKFFSDQSYVEQIGNIVDLANGDKGAATKFLTSIASQLIPLSGLQRWTAQLIDDVKRKSSSEFSAEAIVDNLLKQIPVASKSIEPQRGMDDQPIKTNRLNQILPTEITEENTPMNNYYEGTLKMNQFQNIMDVKQKEIEKKINKER